MRKPIDQTPNAQRGAVSAPAWCIHCILTSPSYRKRGGPDAAQTHMLKACEGRISDRDRQQLSKMGHKAYAPQPAEAREFVAPEDRA